MSTHATIAIKRDDGKIETLYLHHDGYESHCLKTLVKHYPTKDLIDKLFSLGDLSAIDETIEKCDAYHRDRDEDWENVKPYVYDNLEDALKYCSPVYFYLFDNDCWQVIYKD